MSPPIHHWYTLPRKPSSLNTKPKQSQNFEERTPTPVALQDKSKTMPNIGSNSNASVSSIPQTCRRSRANQSSISPSNSKVELEKGRTRSGAFVSDTKRDLGALGTWKIETFRGSESNVGFRSTAHESFIWEIGRKRINFENRNEEREKIFVRIPPETASGSRI